MLLYYLRKCPDLGKSQIVPAAEDVGTVQEGMPVGKEDRLCDPLKLAQTDRGKH